MATRGYVEVTRKGGKGTVHTPRGGNFTGATFDVTVPEGTTKGWYRTQYERGFRGGPSIYGYTLTKVDPAKEAERLRGLNMKAKGYARTGSPGIAGYQPRAEAADSAARVRVEHNENFAKLMDRAAAKEAPPEPKKEPRSSRWIASMAEDEYEKNDDLFTELQDSSYVASKLEELLAEEGLPTELTDALVSALWGTNVEIDMLAFTLGVQAYVDALRAGESYQTAEGYAEKVAREAGNQQSEAHTKIRAAFPFGIEIVPYVPRKHGKKRRKKATRRNNPTPGPSLISKLKF
jgi:hypothetical protein